MANHFSNSSAVIHYLTSQKKPKEWKTPRETKTAYAKALAAQNSFAAEMEKGSRQAAKTQRLTDSSAYHVLAQMYDKVYGENAALAAGRAMKQADTADAGFGNSYSGAAADTAYSAFMAKRAAATPSLLNAAEAAAAHEKANDITALNAMNRQRGINTAALQTLYQKQYSDYLKKAKAQQQARTVRDSSLAALYQYLTQLEKSK